MACGSFCMCGMPCLVVMSVCGFLVLLLSSAINEILVFYIFGNRLQQNIRSAARFA